MARDRSAINRWRGIATTTAILGLPAVYPGLFSWLHGFTPLPVFYYLFTLGKKQGTQVTVTSFCLAGLLALGAGSLPVLLLSALLIPVGYLLERNGRLHQSPVKAGAEVAGWLLGSWLLFWLLLGALHSANPYQEAVGSLQQGLETTRQAYLESAHLSRETREEVAAAFQQLHQILPAVFPALLLMTVLGTSWLNLIGGHWLLARRQRSPWPPYREWRLPEQLVWGLILAGTAMLIPQEELQAAGGNLLLVLGMCYFFQGAAILTALFSRWSVPTFLRTAVYVLIGIQVYGLFLVAALGVIDTWADFRKRRLEA